MATRFYLDEPLAPDATTATLSGNEGHHLSRVMRGSPGDEVILFDGTGYEFEASIESIKRDTVILEITKRTEVDRETRVPVHLACSIPKGDRQRVLIEKAVEIGVHTLIPLQTQYSNEQFKDKSRERWARYVIDASKQCGRNRLMNIAPITKFKDLVNSHQEMVRFLAHPYAVQQTVADSGTAPAEPTTAVCVAIGPEGGFSDEEAKQAADQGWRIAQLGPRILRVETAAVIAVCCALTGSWIDH